MKVQTTFQGAGVIHGDLTPECASMVGTVLDALGGLRPARVQTDQGAAVPRRAPGSHAPAGGRGGCCRNGPGQPVKALVHITLANLVHLNGSSALTGGVDRPGCAPRWAARRAGGDSETGSDGGAYLDGNATQAPPACDVSTHPHRDRRPRRERAG